MIFCSTNSVCLCPRSLSLDSNKLWLIDMFFSGITVLFEYNLFSIENKLFLSKEKVYSCKVVSFEVNAPPPPPVFNIS